MLAEYQKRKIFGMLMFEQISEDQCFAFNMFTRMKPCWSGVLDFGRGAAQG